MYTREIRQGLAKLASYQYEPGTTIKVADLGSDNQDDSFEQSFANIAHSYLRTKAPTLLDYEIGFSMLDRSEDSKKAAGVFGFKVGKQWMFAPMFFLNGDLKGHELLYLKDQDLFVPLKEAWLNYLLNRKPQILGESVTRNSRALGVLAPDLSRLSQAPYKRAEVSKEEAKQAFDQMFDRLADIVTTNAAQYLETMGKAANLDGYLETCDIREVEQLIGWCQEMPKFAAAFQEHHGLDKLAQAVTRCETQEKLANSILAPTPQAPRALDDTILGSYESLLPESHRSPIKSGALKVVTYDFTESTAPPRDLSDEDREQLRRDQFLIQDQRADHQVTIPYNTVTDKTFFNPDDTGLYYVLTKAENLEKCLVLKTPLGPNGRGDFQTVVRLTDPRNWRNIPKNSLWAGSQLSQLEFDEWFKDQPEGKDLKEGWENRYVALGPNGECTMPFHVVKKLDIQNRSPVYEVSFSKDCCGPYDTRRDYLKYNNGCGEYDGFNEQFSHGSRIHVDGKQGLGIYHARGDMFLPKTFKIIRVQPEAADKDRKKEENAPGVCLPSGCYDSGESDNPPILPGNIMDVEMELMGKTSALNIWNDGIEVQINDGNRMTPLAGLLSLVSDHGLREADARDLLKRAAAQKKFRCRVIYPDWIKSASPYLTGQGPTSPSFPSTDYQGGSIMGNTFPTQPAQEHEIPVSSMQARQNDRFNPLSSLSGPERHTLNQAVQSGQKEIFDTATLGSMLRPVRDDTLISRSIGPLTQGMNAAGQLLLTLYWHGDKLADQYGKADMPELEDTIRNTFELSGDTVLFLRQKQISPYPEEAGVGVDLSASANS